MGEGEQSNEGGETSPRGEDCRDPDAKIYSLQLPFKPKSQPPKEAGPPGPIGGIPMAPAAAPGAPAAAPVGPPATAGPPAPGPPPPSGAPGGPTGPPMVPPPFPGGQFGGPAPGPPQGFNAQPGFGPPVCASPAVPGSSLLCGFCLFCRALFCSVLFCFWAVFGGWGGGGFIRLCSIFLCCLVFSPFWFQAVFVHVLCVHSCVATMCA
jgi:hypothetical protein